MYKKLGSLSNESVQKATGHDWAYWIKAIDALGGAKMTHKEIAAKLNGDRLIESGWWAQGVTVGYEYAKGRRTSGDKMPIPKELKAAFSTRPALKKAFAALSPTQKREYIESVSDAKQPETRARRVKRIVSKLLE